MRLVLLLQEFLLNSLLVQSRETREFARFAVTAADLFCFNSAKPPEGSRPSCVPPFLTNYSSSSNSSRSSKGGCICCSGTGDSLWECVGEPLAVPSYLRRFLIDSNGVGSVSPFILATNPNRPCCLPTLLSVCSYARAQELPLMSPTPKPHFPFFLQFIHRQQQQQQQQQKRHDMASDRIALTRLSLLQQHNDQMQQLLQQQAALLLLLLPAPALQLLRRQSLSAVGGQLPPLPLLEAAFQVRPGAAPFAAVMGASSAVAAAAVELLTSRPTHLMPASLRQYPLHLLLQLLQSQRAAAAEVEALERIGLAARAAAGGPPNNPLLWEALRAVLLELTVLLSDRFASTGGWQQQQQQQQQQGELQQQHLEWVVAEGDKVPSAFVLLLLFSQAHLVANVAAELWRCFLQLNRSKTKGGAAATAATAAGTAEGKASEVLLDTVKAFSPKHLSGAEAEWSYLAAKTDALLLLLLQFSHFKSLPAADAAEADAEEGAEDVAAMAEDAAASSSSSGGTLAAADAALHHAQWWRRVGDCRRLSSLFCLSSLSGKGEELSERQQHIKQQRGLSVHLSSRQLLSLAASSASSSSTKKDILLLYGFAAEASRLLSFMFNGEVPQSVSGAPSDWVGALQQEEELGCTDSLRDALALSASFSRAREWAEPPAFFFFLLLIRAKCFRRIAAVAAAPAAASDARSNDAAATAAAAVAAVSDAAEASYPQPVPDIAAFTAAAAAATSVGAAAADSSSHAPNGDTKGEASQRTPTGEGTAATAAAAAAGSAKAAALSTVSSLHALALCDAADALLLSCIQSFGADSILAAEGRSPQLGPSSPRNSNHAQRNSDGGSSSSSSNSSSGSQRSGAAAEGRRFVSSQVSLQLYLEHAGDIESLVEADGDIMPIVLPLYRLHAMRVRLLLQSGGRLWRLAALFPWKYTRPQQQQQHETLAALDAALYMWRTGKVEALLQQQQQQQQQQQPVLPGDHLLPLQSAADVMRDAVDCLQYLAAKR